MAGHRPAELPKTDKCPIARLESPLPWDHIDTGISKTWLATDLQKALEGITVPDCAHSGLCSECGVCGDDFGDNVVAEVPPIPEFAGHYRPDSTRAQRLVIRFGKQVTVSVHDTKTTVVFV